MNKSGEKIKFDALCDVLRERGASARSVTAVAGPPGAGKSTLADRLAEALNNDASGRAAVFPMDGYHYDDMILNARGWRPRKGAPHTFDVEGFRHMLDRLRHNIEDEIAVPVFDRSIETARNSARIIDKTTRHLIVEGNYLLLDQAPWTGLADYFDTTVFIEVDPGVLRGRLEDRWKALDRDARLAKLEENDLPNARLVQAESRPAEFRFSD
ncbi:MAG: AAA family ATPase [Pseudomonadota bacterium]